MTRAWIFLATGAFTLCTAARVHAAERLSHSYVISIGYNGLPGSASPGLEPLRFADDDAIAFAAFAAEGAKQTHVLTIVDADTQRRLGASLPSVQPPTAAALRDAVAEVRAALDRDAQSGVETTVYLYYSGHGTDEAGHDPALTLVDEDLTRPRLYDDVLASLPATHVHLFVDACHAEAVVRPRDAQAAIERATDDDLAEVALTQTLARFPAVGAVLAATRSAQTHEWDAYSGGVFTHELLSALRGAADVDGNGRIEYSEVAAFLSAANGGVTDPRAHLQPIVRAPLTDPRVAIFDLRERADDAILHGRVDGYGLVSVEDEQGDRIVDLRAEVGHVARLLVPADKTLYVRTERGEAVMRAQPGARVALSSLAFGPPDMVARGAIESALRHGLFATTYGRSYYRGYLDHASDLVPVPLAGDDVVTDPLDVPASRGSSRTAGWVTMAAAGALGVGATVFGVLAVGARSTADDTSLEREAHDAANRYTVDSAAFAVMGGCAVVSGAIGVYLLLHERASAAPRAVGFDPARLSLTF